MFDNICLDIAQHVYPFTYGLHDDAPTYLKAKTLSFRMVQCIAKMRLGWHCLAIHTGRYNGIVRDDRVCRLCQKLGYRDDTKGSVPVEDLVHFMLDCRALSKA